MSKLKQQQSF